MICAKEIMSWFPWCPRNAVVWDEIPKCFREPGPAFGFLISACCQEPSQLAPALGSSRFLARSCLPPSPQSLEELSQHCCNHFGWLLPKSWCYSAPVSLWKGYLLEARAFCITVEHDIIFVQTREELRAHCAFLGGTEERGMLPAHPMSWYHLPAWAEGKVTNIMLKKKFPFYY